MKHWLQTIGAMTLAFGLSAYRRKRMRLVEKPIEKPAAPAAVSAEAKPAAAESEAVVIDYNDAEIQSVLRTLATKAGVNLIMGDEVVGKVTVHLEGVTYEDAMHLVVESKGFCLRQGQERRAHQVQGRRG